MKPIVAIIVFFSLMVPSLFLGYANYVTAKEHIIRRCKSGFGENGVVKSS